MNPFNYLVVNTTNRCNTICKYCFQSADSFKNGEDYLDFEKFKSIVDFTMPKAGQHKIIHFTGGEPMLNKHFFDMLDYAIKCGYIIRIQTNGLLLNDCGKKEMELLSQPNVSLKISLDGATAEQHHYLRQKGTFDRVIAAIQKATQYNKVVGIKTCVHKLNLDHLGDLLDFCVESNVAGFSYNVIRREGSALRLDPSCCEGIDEFEIVKRLVPYFNQPKYQYLLNGNQIAMYYFSNSHLIASSCHFYIDYDGRIYSYQECLPEQYIGDLKKGNLEEQFDAELAIKLRYVKSTTPEVIKYVKDNLKLQLK